MNEYEAELRKNQQNLRMLNQIKMQKTKKEEIYDEIKIHIGLFYELFHQQ